MRDARALVQVNRDLQKTNNIRRGGVTAVFEGPRPMKARLARSTLAKFSRHQHCARKQWRANAHHGDSEPVHPVSLERFYGISVAVLEQMSIE